MKELVTHSCLTLCDPMTVACQAPLSMEFSRNSRVATLSSEDLPDPGVEPRSLALQADLPSEPLGKPENIKKISLGESLDKTHYI